jgi:hypothetical protein
MFARTPTSHKKKKIATEKEEIYEKLFSTLSGM